jgi:hypothetical protein
MSVSSGSSDSNTSGNSLQEIHQSQVGNSQGQGSYANGPVNAQQLLSALGSAQGVFQGGNPTINSGLDSVNSGANSAMSLFGTGNPTLAATLSGQFLSPNSNPYLDANYQHAAGLLEGQSRSAWGGQDTVPGSGGFQQGALLNAQGNLANQMLGGNYTAERANQQQALGMLPSYTSGMLTPGQAQVTAGYTPINEYIKQLGSLAPGTAGQYQSNNATNSTLSGTTTGSSQSNTSGSNTNISAKVKG